MDDLMTKDQRDKFMAFLLNQRKEIMDNREAKIKAMFDDEIDIYVDQVNGNDQNMGMDKLCPYKTFKRVDFECRARNLETTRQRLFINVARGGVYLIDKRIKLPVGAVLRAYGEGYWPIGIFTGEGAIESSEYCEILAFPNWNYDTLVQIISGKSKPISFAFDNAKHTD